jgi:DNA phosphorothioation-dependent restriction protein DptH
VPSFCSLDAPGKGLQRARVLSNRQFRISASHAEVMARLKNKSTPRDDQHVVLGFGDYQPWQALVDALHHRAEWVVCIDPNVDAQLIAQKAGATHEAREIIGFGSGVGTHGEANFTISTEQFRLSDVLYKLTVSIEELCSSWSSARIAESVLDESRRLSGLSLVRATGIGQYIRDFMAYALTRKLLKTDEDVLCDQLVSLDAFHHWFDSAYSDVRPDLLWLTATVGESGRLRLDLRLIECKLAKRADTHLEKAREQLESGLEHLISVFMPRTDAGMVEDERPDQRYWWLQLHRLIASNSKILGRDQKRVLSALERLAEGEFDVSWRAAAVTFWTDQSKADISQTDSWPFSIEGLNMNIGIVSCGTEFVQALCEKQADSTLPWSESCVQFRATGRSSLDEPNDDADEAQDGAPDETPKGVVKRDALPDIGPPHSEAEVHATRSLTKETHRPQIPGRILLGQSISGSRDVYWEFGHSELNNRHMLIFGTSGMGKTYTIQCLLFELGRVGQNSLIVDYTNGFFDSQLESVFRSKLQPIQHVIKKEPLSINPFRQQIGLVVDEPLPEAASSTAQRVSGVFSEVYSFGDQQKSALYQAIKTGLERSGTRGMTLVDLLPLLEELAEEKGTVGQAAGSVASKIIPFVDQNPFGEEDPESWEKIFTDITNRCHILQLSGFAKDSTRLVTEFSLIDLYSFYRSRGTQHSPRVVVLDEIQNLDHREESPLAQLLCEGRKFGFSLILATQIMSSLNRDERDRLFNAAHKLFFRPADTEIKTYAEIAAVSTGEKADVWVKRLAKLKKGQCYSIGPSLNEVSGELEVKAFSIQISPLNKRIMNV